MAVTFTDTTWTPPGALTPSTGDVWGIADHDVTFDLPNTTWSVGEDVESTGTVRYAIGSAGALNLVDSDSEEVYIVGVNALEAEPGDTVAYRLREATLAPTLVNRANSRASSAVLSTGGFATVASAQYAAYVTQQAAAVAQALRAAAFSGRTFIAYQAASRGAAAVSAVSSGTTWVVLPLSIAQLVASLRGTTPTSVPLFPLVASTTWISTVFGGLGAAPPPGYASFAPLTFTQGDALTPIGRFTPYEATFSAWGLPTRDGELHIIDSGLPNEDVELESQARYFKEIDDIAQVLQNTLDAIFGGNYNQEAVITGIR